MYDERYSTTRRLITERPVCFDPPVGGMVSLLKTPDTDQKISEGGLRLQGFFKTSTEDKPLITIVTVVYNGATYLEETIKSVIEQTYDNVEYIIVDGGSTDGTIGIIRKYENSIDYWVSEPDRGIYDAMNKGIDLSSGEWINFINSDDYLYSQHSLKQISIYMIKNTDDISIFYGGLALINSKKEVVSIIARPWQKAKKKLKDKLSIPHQAAFTGRRRILNVGKFNTKYKIAGDYDLTLRVLNGAEAIYAHGLIVSGMRIGGISSDPNNSIQVLREYRRIQKENGYIYPAFQWIMAVFRVQVRRLLLLLLGEKITYHLMDIGNRLVGRDTYWNKR